MFGILAKYHDMLKSDMQLWKQHLTQVLVVFNYSPLIDYFQLLYT